MDNNYLQSKQIQCKYISSANQTCMFYVCKDNYLLNVICSYNNTASSWVARQVTKAGDLGATYAIVEVVLL